PTPPDSRRALRPLTPPSTRKEREMNRAIPALAGAAALAPVGNLVAAAQAAPAAPAATSRTIVVKKTVSGSEAQADRWGYIRIQLVVRKTTTITGTRKKVTRRIVSVT